MVATTTDIRHIRRLWHAYRAFRHVPGPLRRPRTLARTAAIGACLWFASLFGALGLSADRSSPELAAFVAAGLAGLCGALSIALRRYLLGGLLGAGMLVTGHLTSVALLI